MSVEGIVLIIMRIRLLLSPEQRAGWRLLAPLACSALLHGAALAGALNYFAPGGPEAGGAAEPRYDVQILHLAPRLYWPAADVPPTKSAPGPKRRTRAIAPGSSSSPQTLVVEGARSLARLAHAIPLPVVLPGIVPKPMPAHAEQVRVDGPQPPPQVPREIAPDAPLPPQVNI